MSRDACPVTDGPARPIATFVSTMRRWAMMPGGQRRQSKVHSTPQPPACRGRLPGQSGQHGRSPIPEFRE